MIKVFYLERTNMVQQRLRRYVTSSMGGECGHSANYGYHNHDVAIGDVEVPEMGPSTKYPGERDYHPLEVNTSSVDENGKVGVIDVNDPRWPTHCLCGYKFEDSVGKQYFPERLYRRVDTGELMTLRNAPVGAMWHSDYSGFKGPDGKCLHVRCPGNHDWMVDGVASNCTSPCKHCNVPKHSHQQETCSNPGDGRDWTKGQYQDSVPEHRCWVRHGDPRTGEVHVDKNGVTCQAGAGSIVVPGWHGFLHNGYLVTC